MDAGAQLPAVGIPGLRQLQTVVPTNGQTVQITNTALFGITLISPAGTLATLTVNLPTDATSILGQVERIAFLKAITTLTIGGPATLYGAPVSAAIGDNIGFEKIAADTWTRLT